METKQTGEPIWHSTFSDLDLSGAKLTHLRRITDASIGEIDEFELESIPSKELVFRKEIPVEGDKQLTPEGLRRLKARVHHKHENLATIYGFKLESTTESQTKLSLFFEPFATNAESEFQKRQQNRQFFDEEELTSSLSAVAEALAFLQKQRISHGNIGPSSILMSNEGEIKLLDHSLFANEHSAYFACLKGSQIPYLAPELFSLLKQDKSGVNRVNAYKADVFALGMTFLYAALLEEPIDCYNWETLTFNSANLSKRIERVYKKYPGQFSNLLSHTLHIEAAHRPDAQSLLANFEYYQRNGASDKASTYQTPEKLMMSRGAITQQDHLKSSHFITPNKESQSFSASQVNFVDPRVQEIIREAKERNWIRGTASADHAYQDESSEEQFTLLKETGIKYRNPFLEGSRDNLKQSGFIYKVVTQETDESKFDRSKFIHNSPEVNGIIASFKKSKGKVAVIERRPDLSVLYSKTIESQVNKLVIGDEKSFGDAHYSTYKNYGEFTHTETPEKKTFSFYDPYKTYLSSHIMSPAATTMSPKKIQSKEEIIRELREKFGSKQKLFEEKKVNIQIL